MSFNIISIVGLGYIGLPTAAMFAAAGRRVVGVDSNRDVVQTVNAGRIHIVEPDLDEIVRAAVGDGLLSASTVPSPSAAFVIAVPTPFSVKGSDELIPEPDLSYIRAASESVASVLKKGDLIILESTSPVGTTEKMAAWLSDARPDLSFPQDCGGDSDIRVAYCPERVLPGNVVQELVTNDRIIGGMTDACSAAAVELYRIFVRGECLVTDARTAEMAKLTENASRDVSIAFANELSIICDKLNIDVWQLIGLANRHPRVNILQPGPGVGGHCIAVDPWFIISTTPDSAKLMHTARIINDSKPAWVIEKIKRSIADFLRDNPQKREAEVTVTCYGLAFKPNIDDLRQSPALDICKRINAMHGGRVLAVEPNIEKLMDKTLELVSIEEGNLLGDIAVLLVDHEEFKGLTVNTKYIVDTKGLW